MSHQASHELTSVASSRVGPTNQGAGGRTVYGAWCSCGWGSTNSASPDSARRKHAKHVAAQHANAEVAADAAGPVEPPHGRLVIDRVNKRTGHRVCLVDADTSDDFQTEEGGRWVLFCCGHGIFVQVEGQRPARDLHGSPQEWCAGCQADAGLHPHDNVPPEPSERVKAAQQAKPKRQQRRVVAGEQVTETTAFVESHPGGFTVATVTATGERSVWASEIETHSEALRRAETLHSLCGYLVRDLCPGLAVMDDPEAVERSYGRSWHRVEVAA